MKSQLAEYFSTVRRRKGIRMGELARLCGYHNVGKGARRIDRFEKSGQVHDELLFKLAAALGIDHQTAARLLEEDRREYLDRWEQWANTPIKPSIILGHIGGFCRAEELPEAITLESAEKHAAKVAKQMKRPICLVFSRQLSVWFDAEGNRASVVEAKPGDVNVPYLQFGHRKVSIDLAAGTTQEVISDFGGVRMRSSFEITEEEPGQITVNIEGPVFELGEGDG